jgi:hypothetical protein
MGAAPARPDKAAANKRPERFIDATRTCSTFGFDIGVMHSNAAHASDYTGKIDANGKQPQGNTSLTTIGRALPAISVYFG